VLCNSNAQNRTTRYSGEYRIDVEHPHPDGVLTDRQMTIFEDG